MPHVQRFLIAVVVLGGLTSPAFAADPASEGQLERLMDMASQMPDRPDHDYVTNSLQAMLRQSRELSLSQQQTEKIKTIADQLDGPIIVVWKGRTYQIR